MLDRYRRFFALLSFLLLATPLVVGIVRPDSSAAILKEGRRLAPAPRTPETQAEWLAFPKQIDAFLGDHFGLRQVLIRAHKDLGKAMLGLSSDSVLVGRDGRLYYLGEDMVRQSAGLVLRDQAISNAAALLAEINDALARRGVRFLVAVPPNSSTIYRDDLPYWAQNRGRLTEYDLFLSQLAARGVDAIDLRPALRTAKSEGPAYYKYDTHWTARGALAGFNAVVGADSHPDWRLDPQSVLGPMTTRSGGDLARLLGVQDSAAEPVEDLTLSAGRQEQVSSDPYAGFVQDSDKAGPTIMLIGDSFTQDYFSRLVLSHAGRVVWLNREHCGFDWKAIDKYRPDEVWWMPTERFLICAPGVRPVDFTG